MNTYRVMQVPRVGVLELAERPLVDPAPGDVRIRVEACGVCHTDALSVQYGQSFPRVPGHEVIGRIEAVGAGTSTWRVGQRVGVGYLGGHCGVCRECRGGHFVHCLAQPQTGSSVDGGYAEVMYARQSGLVAVPEGLDAAEAAPLLCAGLTTFNALRNAGIRAGETVAIQGLGGLGHLAVQYARRMGLRVVAVARGADKGELARELGAHHYIDSDAVNAAAALTELGGARLILSTVASAKAMSALFAGLAPRGQLIALGADVAPLELSLPALLFGGRSVSGALTGTALDAEETLAFSELSGIRARIETMPLERAADAYGKMMRNEARFRMVLRATRA